MKRADPLDRIAGIVLAGGRGSRMGGADKALLPLAGQPLIVRVVARLGCARAISANGDPARFAALGLPVLADAEADFPGPMAGVLAGLDWAVGQGFAGIVTAAVDTPFFPSDLAARLAARAQQSGAAVVLACGASEAGRSARLQPTFAFWSATLAEPVRAALAGGERRVEAVARACGLATLEVAGAQPFLNVNTPADLASADAYAEEIDP